MKCVLTGWCFQWGLLYCIHLQYFKHLLYFKQPQFCTGFDPACLLFFLSAHPPAVLPLIIGMPCFVHCSQRSHKRGAEGELHPGGGRQPVHGRLCVQEPSRLLPLGELHLLWHQQLSQQSLHRVLHLRTHHQGQWAFCFSRQCHFNHAEDLSKQKTKEEILLLANSLPLQLVLKLFQLTVVVCVSGWGGGAYVRACRCVCVHCVMYCCSASCDLNSLLLLLSFSACNVSK